MFTGIIERTIPLYALKRDKENIHFQFKSSLTKELKVDQSVAHNGVCLTVTNIVDDSYWVTAVKETLALSNLSHLKEGELVNIERGMRLNDRLDGHIVQGHVDGTAELLSIESMQGSWEFSFKHQLNHKLILHKGSITVNGVSLTVIHSEESLFKVALIPYSYEHTSFNQLIPGHLVNVELDVLGKYVQSLNS